MKEEKEEGEIKGEWKEMKEDTNKWEDTACLWIRINIVKMAVLLNVIYGIKVIPAKTPLVFFIEIEKKF